MGKGAAVKRQKQPIFKDKSMVYLVGQRDSESSNLDKRLFFPTLSPHPRTPPPKTTNILNTELGVVLYTYQNHEEEYR